MQLVRLNQELVNYIGSETIAGAIREARLAPDVKAVVLRVNSQEEALASDVIWRETVLLKLETFCCEHG